MTATKHETMPDAETNLGESLRKLSQHQPRLVVFLRHSGCPFCREALAELQKHRKEIEAHGVGIVLVHMMNDEEAGTFFAGYHLDDVPRVSDPQRKVYEAFGLARGSASQVMGPGVWWQGFKSTVLKGHLPGVPVGDIFQLPGTFIVHHGKIVAAVRPKVSGEPVDYVKLAESH